MLFSQFAAVLLLTGCVASMHPPENGQAKLFDKEKTGEFETTHLSFSELQCPPAGTANYMMPAARRKVKSTLAGIRMRYSPGDRFAVWVPGSADFSGDYVVNADGLVVLPFSTAVHAVGLTNDQLTRRIEDALIANRLFKGPDFRISVRPVLYASINISVAGAVFYPGRVTIGGVKDSDKGDKSLSKSGDNPGERYVAAALKAGGGVRPDADLAHVRLVRNGKKYELDWRGAITGGPVDDIALIEGDHIEVPEANCFQSALVRPSQITPPGIRIFQSNLTIPASSNATSAIGQQSQSIPYGTRLLAGLVATNCVGGALSSNARRYGLLISRNPKTLRTEVIQRSVEELVRSADRDVINPYLMPDDAIACYDSAITEAREAASVLNTLMAPVTTWKALQKP